MIDLEHGDPLNVQTIRTFRDVWYHRLEAHIAEGRPRDPENLEQLIDGTMTDVASWIGCVTPPRDEEAARIGLAALVNAHHATLANEMDGRCSHAERHAIEGALGFAAIPYLHLLGVGPKCSSSGLTEPPAPPVVPTDARCPGCGQRLFGDVAVRGACLSCFPNADDLAHLLEPGDSTTTSPEG